jgi:hypothetical protein
MAVSARQGAGIKLSTRFPVCGPENNFQGTGLEFCILETTRFQAFLYLQESFLQCIKIVVRYINTVLRKETSCFK